MNDPTPNLPPKSRLRRPSTDSMPPESSLDLADVVGEIGTSALPATREILYQLSIAMFVLDDELRIRRWNRAAARIFQMPSHLARGRHFAEVVPVLQRLNLEPHLKYTMQTGRAVKLLELPVPADALVDRRASVRMPTVEPSDFVVTESHELLAADGDEARQLLARPGDPEGPEVLTYFDIFLDPIVVPGDSDSDAAAPCCVGVAILVQESTERARMRLALASKTEDLEMLFRVSTALRGTMTLDGCLFIALSGLAARDSGGFNRAMSFLVDEQRQVLRGHMGIGALDLATVFDVWNDLADRRRANIELSALLRNHPPSLAASIATHTAAIAEFEIPLHAPHSILSRCMQEQRTIDHEDVAQDGTLSFDPQIAEIGPITHFAAVPLLSGGRSVGALLLDCTEHPRRFTSDALNVLEMYALQAALAIENAYVYERAVREGHTDSLTQLDNHGFFQQNLKRAVQHARRYKQPVSLIMADLDHFKRFNDTYGHPAGDAVLRNFAAVLRSAVRGTDRVARYGGEEFVVILPHTGPQEAIQLAERIRQQVRKKVSYVTEDAQRVRITVSLGVACVPHHGDTPEALVSMADASLFISKKAGRDRATLAPDVSNPSGTGTGIPGTGVRTASETASAAELPSDEAPVVAVATPGDESNRSGAVVSARPDSRLHYSPPTSERRPAVDLTAEPLTDIDLDDDADDA